jgi:hypothetical protein
MVVASSDAMEEKTVALPDKKPSNVRVTGRDIALLTGLFESRIMERRHMTALYFDGRGAMAKERIGKKLVPAEYVALQNPNRHRTERAIYGLGRRGFEELKARGIIERYERQTAGRFAWERLEDRLAVSPWTVEHELAVMDAKVALTTAIERTDGCVITAFSTWPLLVQFQGFDGRCVKPDGYLRLMRPLNAASLLDESFYLEIDRGTEGQNTLAMKAFAYAAHSGSSAFARWIGADEAETVHFRTLFVFVSRPQCGSAAERRNNFLDRLVRDGGHHVVWATTSDDLNRDPLGAIWMTAFDYGAALTGTRFDPHTGESGPKHRSVERDALIRDRARRRPLFALPEKTS